MKKYHSTRYTEYKQKDIGTSCTSVLTSRLQCFNLSKKCWKQYHQNLLFHFQLKYEVNIEIFSGEFVLIEYVTKFSEF